MILMRLESVLSALKDAQAAQRGYLLTGDRTFLSPYIGSFEAARRNLREIDSLTVDSAQQDLRLDTLQRLISENEQLVQKSIVLFAPKVKGIEESASLLQSGNSSLHQIRLLVRRMQESERASLSHGSQEAFRASQITPFALILFFILAILLSIISYLYILGNLNKLKATSSDLLKNHRELGDTKQKLQGVLNSSINGIMAFKALRNNKNEIADFELMLTNPAAETLIGQKLKAASGINFSALFSEIYDSDLFLEFSNVVTTGKPLNNELFSNIYKKWLYFSVVKMDDGISLTFRDISDSKLAEEELKETRHFLKQITDATPDIVLVLNLQDERIVYVNNEVFHSLGYSAAEIYAMEKKDKENLIHPDDWEKSRMFLQSFPDKKDHDAEEMEFRAKDVNGKWRYFCFKGKIFKRSAQHEPLEIIGIAQEISDKKEKEAAIDRKNEELLYAYDELKKAKEYLLKVNQELEERVEERTRTLSDKNLELLKINEFLDTIVYMAAHDLRSPVSSLNLLVNLFAKSKDPEKKANIMEAIKSSAKRLDLTIKGLVEVIEVQHVQGDIISSLSFESILTTVMEENQDNLDGKNGRVFLDFDSGKDIRYVEAYLSSIFKNLITNAIKYAADGRDLVLTISTKHVGDFVILKVADNGIGMDLKKYSKNLFKPFKRFTPQAEGKGIGLHLIKNMIEKNGGSIEVASELGTGTTFTCYLKNY